MVYEGIGDMDSQLITLLAEKLSANTPIALVTVIDATGSTPGKIGAMMLVQNDEVIAGTVGGGSLEHQTIAEAACCLESGSSKEIVYQLPRKSEQSMSCGGEVRLFIRVFQPRPQLVIIGAGHIGRELYKIGIQQDYQVTVFDNRAEVDIRKDFARAECIIAADLVSALHQYPLKKECYITIATSSHDTDRDVLQAVINRDVSYIGMIGSKNKISQIFKQLVDQGIDRERIGAVYAPMGLNIASIEPKEIAFSIFSEILLVKNNGSADHMRTVKNVSIAQD